MSLHQPRAILAALLAAATVPVRAGAEEGALTLSGAYAEALAGSPLLREAASRQDEARAAVREAARRGWPSLSWQSSLTRGDDPVYVFGSLLEQKRFTADDFSLTSLNSPSDLTNFRNALVVSMPVFAGFELRDRGAAARLEAEKAAVGGQAARLEAGLEVLETYLEALAARQEAALLEERVKAADAELEEARGLQKEGRVLGSDFDAASALRGALRSQAVLQAARYDGARARLAVLLGRPEETRALAGALSPSVEPVSREEDSLRAAEGAPELREADLDGKLSESALRLERRSTLPRVELFASAEADTEFSTFPLRRMAGLRLGWPLADLAHGARVEGARARLEESLAQRDERARDVRARIAALLRAARGMDEVLPPLTAARDDAARSLEKFRPLYREGRQSVLEVLRAEEGLARAEAGLVELYLSMRVSRARLLTLEGRLDAAAVSAIESRLSFPEPPR